MPKSYSTLPARSASIPTTFVANVALFGVLYALKNKRYILSKRCLVSALLSWADVLYIRHLVAGYREALWKSAFRSTYHLAGRAIAPTLRGGGDFIWVATPDHQGAALMTFQDWLSPANAR